MDEWEMVGHGGMDHWVALCWMASQLFLVVAASPRTLRVLVMLVLEGELAPELDSSHATAE